MFLLNCSINLYHEALWCGHISEFSAHFSLQTSIAWHSVAMYNAQLTYKFLSKPTAQQSDFATCKIHCKICVRKISPLSEIPIEMTGFHHEKSQDRGKCDRTFTHVVLNHLKIVNCWLLCKLL